MEFCQSGKVGTLRQEARPPLGRPPRVWTSSGGHCSGRYASYWNAFLQFYEFYKETSLFGGGTSIFPHQYTSQSPHTQYVRDYCDAQAGFWLNSKFWSKFSRKPLSGIEDQKAPPHFGKLQIWDDQSLLRNTPPISENFRFGMTKVYSGIPPHFGKLQIWDDQSLLWNTPPPFRKTSDLG